MEANRLIVGDSVTALPKEVGPCRVDLTVTSPPYDSLRDYHGYQFDAAAMLQAIYDATAEGGVCVWVVGDQVRKGDLSLSSFKHALAGQALGRRVHDVMIYAKNAKLFPRTNGYYRTHEYMLVLSKGAPKTFNGLREPNTYAGQVRKRWTHRAKSGEMKEITERVCRPDSVLGNVWRYNVAFGQATTDKFAHGHPAMFPERLAEDHVLSWSNPGDLVLDPMCGSGTTCKMAQRHGRRYIGIDVSADYIEIAKLRTAQPSII